MAKSVSLVVVNVELLFKNRREEKGGGILQRETNAKNTSVCTSVCRGS